MAVQSANRCQQRERCQQRKVEPYTPEPRQVRRRVTRQRGGHRRGRVARGTALRRWRAAGSGMDQRTCRRRVGRSRGVGTGRSSRSRQLRRQHPSKPPRETHQSGHRAVGRGDDIGGERVARGDRHRNRASVGAGAPARFVIRVCEIFGESSRVGDVLCGRYRARLGLRLGREGPRGARGRVHAYPRDTRGHRAGWNQGLYRVRRRGSRRCRGRRRRRRRGSRGSGTRASRQSAPVRRRRRPRRVPQPRAVTDRRRGWIGRRHERRKR